MATTTVEVTINSSTYTALSSGEANVEVFVRRGQSVRFHVAASAPSDSTEAYELIHGPSTAGGDIGIVKVFTGLASDEEVYARLDNVDFRTTDFGSTTSNLIVIRGNSASGSGGSGGLTEADFDTKIGSLTESAPGTDTASSGLNGRLQRVAQRLTSLIALVPASLGPKTSATSFSVVQPSDVSFGSASTLTRPATTPGYSANDVVMDTGGVPLSFTLGAGAGEYMITSASLQINASAIISGETSYILELYNVTPPSALADDAAWDLPSGDRASYLGEVLLGSPVDKGSTLFVETHGINKQITLASANLFYYLVTVGAHTSTASRVYVTMLHTVKV